MSKLKRAPFNAVGLVLGLWVGMMCGSCRSPEPAGAAIVDARPLSAAQRQQTPPATTAATAGTTNVAAATTASTTNATANEAPAAPAPASPAPAPTPAAPAAAPAPAPAPAPAMSADEIVQDAEARVETAERFFAFAQSITHNSHPTLLSLRQSELLLQAAIKVNPVEPRYLRELAQLRKAAGNVAGAISAWVGYRKLLPADEVAQAELIDLYLSQEQSNDAKLSYIHRLLDNAQVPVLVKAHVAVMAVGLLEERSHADAMAMLATARSYYPLPEVTLLEWRMLPADAKPSERLAALLNMVRSNPTNADAIAGVAHTLASVGKSEEALTWYATLMDVHALNGTSAGKEDYVNYLAERYRVGETTVAADKLDEVLQRVTEDADFWFLRLTVQRGDESRDLLRRGEQAFFRRLNGVCVELAPDARSTTAPAAEPATAPSALPDPSVPAAPATAPSTQPQDLTPAAIPLAAALDRLEKIDSPALRQVMASALYDLAWFEIYFNHQPALADPYIAALGKLVPADNRALQRLSGWSQLVWGHADEAMGILDKQRKEDVLSALGVYRALDEQKKFDADEAVGRELLAMPQSGVEGAIVYQATKGRGLKPATRPADVDAMGKLIDAFPKPWQRLVRNPNKFYLLRADPLHVGHHLGEALLATVSVQNTGKMDITIGQLGLVKPVLVYNAEIRGAKLQRYPAISIDRIMGKFVLAPGESISQVVRVDQGPLTDALHTRPANLLAVAANVVSDPQITENSVNALAGGYVQKFERMFTRMPRSLDQDGERRDFFNSLTKGSPQEKIYDVELLASYIQIYAQGNETPFHQNLAQQFGTAIDAARSDPTPGVKLWASYAAAMVYAGPEQRKVLDEMLRSNAWESRLLALLASRLLSEGDQRQLAEKLAADPDPIVSQFAASDLELLQKAAATQPATQPSTAPSTEPSTGPSASPDTVPATAPAAGQ